jgi:hypothetical protein
MLLNIAFTSSLSVLVSVSVSVSVTIPVVVLCCVVDVEEGGETDFPRLGIAVKPKRGRALLWPSTLNANPELQDPRTHHQAKPVIRGTKYAANSWIHLYNYAQPNLWGCTGSFDEL